MADTATLGTIEHIDPAQIEVETNIRTTVKLDPGFVASIREYGVLSPVGCRRTDDGTVTVRIGQRRVLAAREVGLATIPAYIVEGDDSTVERLLEQFVENEQRAALTEPERAAFFQQQAALLTGDVDLVSICTPSGMHVDSAIQALQAGCHVLIEKPVDVDLARARRLVEAAAAVDGLVCTVMSQHRFDPATVVVREAIERGEFGRITSATASIAWWRSQRYYDSSGWRGTWALDGGGALMNQGVHTVDLLLSFLGRPRVVRADFGRLAHERVEVEDTVVATITFESGALATLHATTAAYPGLTARLQIMGERGSAVLEDDVLGFLHRTAEGSEFDPDPRMAIDQKAEHPEAAVAEPSSRNEDMSPTGHIRQYQDLLAALATGRPPRVTLDDAVLALATVRAVYLSASTGEAIVLENVLGGAFDDVVVALPATTGGDR